MSPEEVRSALTRFRPKPGTNENRNKVDRFHGHGLSAVYWKGKLQSITVHSAGDVFGRTVLRPRWLHSNGFALFSHSPAAVIRRISRDVDCDPFVAGRPGAYCVTEFGLALMYLDFEDSAFGSLQISTADYLDKYPIRHRVAQITAQGG
jgi:hypothetical protein